MKRLISAAVCLSLLPWGTAAAVVQGSRGKGVTNVLPRSAVPRVAGLPTGLNASLMPVGPITSVGAPADVSLPAGLQAAMPESSRQAPPAGVTFSEAPGSGPFQQEGSGAQGSSRIPPEAEKAQADQRFDRQAPRPRGETPAAVVAKASEGKGLLSRFFPKPKAAAIETAFDLDQYGGPQEVKLSFKGRVLFGLRWGLTMAGIGTIVELAMSALSVIFPWQLRVPQAVLEGTGRVELFAGIGPAGIVEALSSQPLRFLFLQLPMGTIWEEIYFRGWRFGLLFLILAAVRPVAAFLARALEKMPDLFGFHKIARAALDLAGRISAKAFPLAAAASTAAFVVGHFGAWGIDPATIAVHASLGFALAYVAYKTRSLSAAVSAHLTYNLLSVAGVWLALNSALAGMIYGLLLGVVSVAALYLHRRSYQKARSLAIQQAKLTRAAAALAAGLAILVAGHGMLAPRGERGFQQAEAAVAEVVPSEAEAQVALPTPQKPQGLAAVTAQVKPSVVRVMLPTNMGSGFVISADGLLMTNAHVVDEAPGGLVGIEFADGRNGMGTVVAVNHDKDIALVQLPANPDGWQAVSFGDSEALSEGDEVLAMGHPLNLPFTVTRGIVSGLADRGNLHVQHLQTDAAINRGNSGGPLVNASGEVVGMNTEMRTDGPEGGSIGLGFAIKSQNLKNAVDQYRAAGHINSAWLGVIVNLTAPLPPERGVEIEQVRRGSPAAKAGLKPGDVILGANGQVFGSMEEALEGLAVMIASAMPGEPLELAVGRTGEMGVLTVTLASKP